MGGENKMLIIGINNVDGVVFKKLTNARSDAMRVQGILSSQYSFVDADGSALLDENATRENIMRALHELVNQGFKDDNVVIYYAGHGYQNPKSMAGYLIPFDAYKIPGNRIPFKEVLDIVKEIEAKHVLLIADCCYSGCFITRNRTASGLRAHTVLEKLDSRWVLVSGGEEPVSDGQEGKGSPFANLLCDILGQNKETTLAASQIFEWVIVNMATGYPIPKAAEINCSGHKDGEMIFHLNETNIEKYETPVAKPSFIRPGIKLPGYYLSRTVTFYDDQHEQKTFFSQKVQGDKVLVDLLTTEKRIVILGGAGSGKSIELRNLEKLLDETTAMVPVYQRFNTYSKQDIEDFLPEGYKQVLPSSLVVLLDGFDEIQPENVVDAIRKINRFAEVNPGIRIIISCRTNFYELPAKQQSGLLDNFKVYFLNNISLAEIKKFAEQHAGLDGDKFIHDLYDANYLDLAEKPFFLDILIRHYITHQNFHTNRSQIIEEGSFNYNEDNKAHFRSTISGLTKAVIFGILEKAAFIMETRGLNFIADADLQKLFSPSDYELCKYLPSFNFDEARQQWMFDHNNLQEYVAARVLGTLSFDKLLETVTITSGGTRKIKITWTNTISFFISNGGGEAVRLSEWIMENDPEIMVRFDPDRISDEKRTNVFKRIFDRYSNENIWLRSNKFSFKELARFSDFDATLDYLLEKMTADNNEIVIMNAVMVVSEFNINKHLNYKENVKHALLTLLTHINEPQNIYSILGAMSRLELRDEESINIVVEKFRKSKNQYIRAGLYKLLGTTPLVEEHLDIFIEGLDLTKIEGSFGERDSVNLLDENIHLLQGFEKVESAKKLKEIITVFCDEQKNYLYHSDEKDLVNKIVENSVKAWNNDASIFDFMLDFFHRLVIMHHKRMDVLVVPFFDKTSGRWPAFEAVWRNKKWNEYDKGECLPILLDDNVIFQFIEEYKNNEFDDNDIANLHQMVLWQGNAPNQKDWLTNLETASQTKSAIILVRPHHADYEAQNKVRVQEGFDLLFDKPAFIQRVKSIFKIIDKEIIGQSDLLNFRRHKLSGEDGLATSPAFRILYDFVYNGITTSIEPVLDWINEDIQWQHYVMDQVFQQLSGSHDRLIEVKESHKKYISEWCKKTTGHQRLRWYFIQRFDIQLPEAQVLEFTEYCDFSQEDNIRKPGTIEGLEKFISPKILAERVIVNLKSGLPDTMRFIVNAGFALRKNLLGTYEDIISYIEKSPDNEYKLEHALQLWHEKSGDAARLLEFLHKAVSSYLKFNAATLLRDSEKQRKELVEFLVKWMEDSSESTDNRLEAASLLISMQHFGAFQLAVAYILKSRNTGLEYSSLLGNLSRYKYVEAIPLLLELFALTKQPDFNTDTFRLLESKSMDGIFYIGVQSDNNLIETKRLVEKFISDNSAMEGVNYLKLLLIRMEDQLNLEQSQSPSVETAIDNWNNLKTG